MLAVTSQPGARRSFLMTSMAEMSAVLQTLVTETADAAGRASGFTKRVSKLSGARFVQVLVFGWLANPAATLNELAQLSALLAPEAAVSAAALAQRFGAAGAACLRQVLEAA